MIPQKTTQINLNTIFPSLKPTTNSTKAATVCWYLNSHTPPRELLLTNPLCIIKADPKKSTIRCSRQLKEITCAPLITRNNVIVFDTFSVLVLTKRLVLKM